MALINVPIGTANARSGGSFGLVGAGLCAVGRSLYMPYGVAASIEIIPSNLGSFTAHLQSSGGMALVGGTLCTVGHSFYMPFGIAEVEAGRVYVAGFSGGAHLSGALTVTRGFVAPPVILVPPSAGPLILCDQLGRELTELEVVHTIRFERSRAASVKYSIGYDQNGAVELLNLLQAGSVPQVRLYRNGKVLLSAHWYPQQEVIDGTESEGIACEFRSPFAKFETRFLMLDTMFTATDAGQIPVSLINTANAAKDTGLRMGTVQPTVNRDRTYGIGQQIASAIIDLTEVDNGFSFTETMVDSSALGYLSTLNIWSNLGRDLTDTVRFEYGEYTIANVSSVQRTISLPINQVILTSEADTGPIVSIANATVSQDRVGIYSYAENKSDIKVQSTLDEMAVGMLQPDFIQQVSFEPDIDVDPKPIDDYWLGDIAHFFADQDAFQNDTDIEINAIEIQRDGDGRELSHKLEFGHQIVQPLIPVRRGRNLTFRDARRT